MQDAVLGLDVGTSALKAVLYTQNGCELFATQQSYRLAKPRPGWVELDGEEMWRALIAVLRAAAAAAGATTRIASLALAAQAGSMVPVGADGQAVAPMITWLDQRAEPLVAGWRADGSAARIRQISGWRPQAGLPLACLAWLTRNDRTVAERTARYLGAHDYLVQRLTGQCVTDLSAGAETLLLDHTTGAWSEELCELAGIRVDQLPALASAGAIAGGLLPEVQVATGLRAGTVVVVGGHDQCCAALGMGVTAPGQVMLAAGTAWVITALTNTLTVDRVPEQMDLNFHVAPNVRTVSQLLGGFGATVEWWLDVAWSPATGAHGSAARAELYAALDRALLGSQAGAHDLLFLPPGCGTQGNGGTAGGGFSGLRLDHGRADMARAILEGVAFAVRAALDALAQAGLPADRMWMSGGAARSPVWPGILASVTGVPLLLAVDANWPARGAGLLAAVGSGRIETLEEASSRWRAPLDQVEPDGDLRRLYGRRYRAYRELASILTMAQED